MEKKLVVLAFNMAAGNIIHSAEFTVLIPMIRLIIFFLDPTEMFFYKEMNFVARHDK
jgi:hypothetical protein